MYKYKEYLVAYILIEKKDDCIISSEWFDVITISYQKDYKYKIPDLIIEKIKEEHNISNIEIIIKSCCKV